MTSTSMADGLQNVISGLGFGEADKSAANSYCLRRFSDQEIEEAYRSSAWTRKVHDIPAFEMTRAGRDWQADGPDITAIEAQERKLQIWPKLRRTLVAARLFGGAALVVGTRTGNLADELRPETVRKGDVTYVSAVARSHLAISDGLITDATSPYYGEPVRYQVRSGEGEMGHVHPSRVISIRSNELPLGSFESAKYWGDPLLFSLWDTLTNADSALKTTAAMLPEAVTDVLKVPNFGANIGMASYEQSLIKRVALAKLFSSMFHVKIIDGGADGDGTGEDWQTRQFNFSGLPEINRMFAEMVAGASDIPVTRLTGQASGGLNSTGKGEERDWLRAISARQESDLRPALDRLDEILVRSALGSYPAGLWWKFSPLFHLDEQEAAEVEFKQAQAYKIYLEGGAMDPDALTEAAVNGISERGLSFPGLAERLAEASSEVDPTNIDLADAAPRPLYVRRDLVNVSEFRKWAKAQGFTDIDEGLHVTITYSRSPIDWMEMGEGWFSNEKGGISVKPGGPRLLEVFDGGAVVLAFASDDLAHRNLSMREKGASWDFPDYQPHITINYSGGIPEGAEPYRGELIFGPEIFEEIRE